jgi:hypothetical protein
MAAHSVVPIAIGISLILLAAYHHFCSNPAFYMAAAGYPFYPWCGESQESGAKNQDNKNQEKRVNNIYTEDYKKELDSRIKAYKNGRVVYSEEEVMKSLKQILNKNQQR